MARPARRYCAATRYSSGPQPANTAPSTATALDFSSSWAAPAVITPGSVQPATGIGRSRAPVARMTRSAAISRIPSPSETASRKPRSMCQTPAPGTYSTALSRRAAARPAPAA